MNLMDRIPRIEGDPAIVNEAAGYNEILAFLSRVHRYLSEDDPRYPFYLTWLGESASNAARSQLGPDSLETLRNRLTETDPQSENADPDIIEGIIEENEIEIDEYRFSLVFVLCKVYLELGEVSNAIDVLDESK